MKLHRKIDLFFYGKYICSTRQAKTCKEAKVKYLKSVEELIARKEAYPPLPDYIENLRSQVRFPCNVKARFSI